ncbi:MAG TPA: hypothetical protein VNG90_02070 [Candidatus Acidoferrum sp.]|nr:hypothetical protein [Candidatus Acidoferrum sp.]
MIFDVPGIGEVTVMVLSKKRKPFAEVLPLEPGQSKYCTHLKSRQIGPGFYVRISFPSQSGEIELSLRDNPRRGERQWSEARFLLEDRIGGVDTYRTELLSFRYGEGELSVRFFAKQIVCHFSIEYTSRRTLTVVA